MMLYDNGALLITFSCTFICITDAFQGSWKALPSESERRNLTISSEEKEIFVVKGDSVEITYFIRGELTKDASITLVSSKDIVDLPPTFHLQPKDFDEVATNFTITLNATKQGIATISLEVDSKDPVNIENAFVLLSIELDPTIDDVSEVIGWIYTIAWDISFFPQILHNWRRKSVVGLSFDFLLFNLIGFFCYFLFNAGLHWLPGVQDQYYFRHPQTVLHVRLNDVIFPLYAVICTVIQIIQCGIYERRGQRVSRPCMVISSAMGLSIVIYAILVPSIDKILWLDFLYWMSYIKLAITCIKYTPQLYENFKHKSTEGWNIWQVILDCTGGSFSLLQMFLLAYNYDDFQSILTDPTKLGLGLLSIFFNIFFFIQHYCLYRNNSISSNLDGKASKSSTELHMS